MKRFSDKDKQLIFELIYKLVGSQRIANEKASVFLSNISRRMSANNIDNFSEYLYLATRDQQEYDQLISALTIHTTHWFRENSHFEKIETWIKTNRYKDKTPITALSVGCSTGEEVYSLALTLQKIYDEGHPIEYQVKGLDIDPISIQFAEKAVYNDSCQKQIPQKYWEYLLHGTGKTQGLMTIQKVIRNHCSFLTGSILELSGFVKESFDIIICRNILIYFNQDQIEKILDRYHDMLKPGGILVLGHSEALIEDSEKFQKQGHTIFKKLSRGLPQQEDLLVFAKHNTSILQNIKDYLTQTSVPYQKFSDLFELEKGIESQHQAQVLFIHRPQSDSEFHWLTNPAMEKMSTLGSITVISDLKDELPPAGIHNPKVQIMDNSQPQKILEHMRASRIKLAEEAKKPKMIQEPLTGHILVVDDDADVGNIHCEMIESLGLDATFCDSGKKALELIQTEDYSLVLSDLVMPEMSGLELFREARKLNPDIQGILITGYGDKMILKSAEDAGYSRVFDKPVELSVLKQGLQETLSNKPNKKRTQIERKSIRPFSPDLILVGASTGGTVALETLLRGFHRQSFCPPIVVVQHIPIEFAGPFAKRLADASNLQLGAITNQTMLQSNTIYVAQGDYHLGLKRKGGAIYCSLSQEPEISGHKPSVDFLFHAGAKLANQNIFAILLTGMGKDGAQGMKALYDTGAFTAAQDESSSVVYGMPKEAIALGAVHLTGNLQDIREKLDEFISTKRKRSA